MAEEKKYIHEGHRERLRERYRELGLDHFQDHEVLELLLGYTILQKDTNPIAHRLVDQFDDLRGVLEAEEHDLLKISQLGPGTAFFLSLIRDVARRYFEQTKSKPIRILEPSQAVQYFLPHFVGRRTECVYAAFLDQTRRVIDCAKVFDGSVDTVQLQTKRLLKEALKRNCRYVVLAHNHFTDTVPSLEDIAATRHARIVLLEHNIGIVDHVIICGGLGSSMVDTGHFAKTKPILK